MLLLKPFILFSNWLDKLFAYPVDIEKHPACTADCCAHTKVKEKPLPVSKSTSQLRTMTKTELREYAAQHKFDLSLRYSKTEMISRIISRVG